MKDFLELAHDRYSVRKLSDQPVEDEKLEKILEAGIVAPTAVNYQPFKIFLFRSRESIEKLSEAHHFQFGRDAQAVFIIGSDSSRSWKRQFDGMDFGDVDASIVATHMMLEIHDLGLGSTWCGHFDAEKVKQLFPETAGYNLIAMLPVGYIAEDAEPSRNHTIYRDREELVKVY